MPRLRVFEINDMSHMVCNCSSSSSSTCGLCHSRVSPDVLKVVCRVHMVRQNKVCMLYLIDSNSYTNYIDILVTSSMLGP